MTENDLLPPFPVGEREDRVMEKEQKMGNGTLDGDSYRRTQIVRTWKYMCATMLGEMHYKAEH